jgi:flavin-binding protein dodecin
LPPQNQLCNHHYVKGPGEEQPTAASAGDKLRAWFESRMPDDWFGQAPEITLDREEITVIGVLPVSDDAASGSSAAERAAAAVSHIRRFREQTRQQRIEIAREAEHRFSRKVSWGVLCDEKIVMFTTFSVPVMTRLRQPERLVLDTLVDAGVARSRSDALAWCVRLVGEHEEAWLAELRAALHHVEQVRSDGPRS